MPDTPKPYVVCDTCGWREEVENSEATLEWHRKPCPQCGGGEIVNDAEYVTTRLLIECEAAMKAIAPLGARFETIAVPVKIRQDLAGSSEDGSE